MLLAAICLCGVTALAEDDAAAGPNIPAAYEKVAESSRFNLYLDQKTLAIIVESKANGSILSSVYLGEEKVKGQTGWIELYTSGLVVEYIEDLVGGKKTSLLNDTTTIQVEMIENGFKARIDYTDIGISHDFILTLDEAGLRAEVPQDSIKMVKDKPYLIVADGDGEMRVDLKEKTKEVKEYVLIDAEGKKYIIPEDTTSKVVPQGTPAKSLKIPVSDGKTQVVPMTKRYVLLTAADGSQVEIPTYLLAAKAVTDGTVDENGKAVTTYVLVTEDGTEYPVTDDIFAKATKLKLTVKDTDGKNVDFNLNAALAPVATISVIDEGGKTVKLPYDQVTNFEINIYRTGTNTKGKSFKYLDSEIIERSESSYFISGLYIYPFLGQSYMGEDEGYMIVPDGQGAIIELKNNEERYNSPFKRRVYGTNIGIEGEVYNTTTNPVETAIMPVFGMVHTADQIGFLGVIEEGDYSATIYAYLNGNGTSKQFDWTCAHYEYRRVYEQPMGMNGSVTAGTITTRTPVRELDIVQHFLLADGDDASYAGLAVAYRNYLISKGTFANASDRPFDVQLDILNMERENYIFGKQDVVMTSFENVEQIIGSLKELGVDEMAVVLRGWQKDGLTGGLPTDGYNPASSLGGKDGLKSLRQYAEKQGVDFALEADVLSLNVDTHPSLKYSALKKITSATYERPTFGKVYSTMMYLNPKTSAEKAAVVVDELHENGVKGVSFTGITRLLVDYYYKDEIRDATSMAKTYIKILKDANKLLTVTLSRPNAYLWPYADVITDLPIGGSDHTYTAAEVPFLAIALSGQVPYYAEYVNFQANNKEFFLHLMEQGARPSFLLTWEDPIELQDTNSMGIYSSKYDLYEEMIVTWYKDLNDLNEKVGEDGVIVNHERFGDMVRVTWSNGTQVYLNFGDKEATLDGVTLKKHEWKVVSAGGN